MKRSLPTLLFFYVALTLLVGCKSDPVHETAYGAPVPPIRLTSDTQTVELKYHLPLLVQECIVDKQVFTATGRIEVYSFNTEDDTLHLPVLPNKPVQQALMTTFIDDPEVKQVYVSLRFTRPMPHVHMVAFVQNIQIPSALINEQEDGTWLIKIEPRLSGNSLLRVYAENDYYLFNDIQVPLHDGHPVQTLKRFSRSDAWAEILSVKTLDSTHNAAIENPALLELRSPMRRADSLLCRELAIKGAHSLSVHMAISPVDSLLRIKDFNKDTLTAQRSLLSHVLAFTLPGIPCVYDESDFPKSMQPQYARLKKLRQHSMPLIYGEYIPIYSDANIWEYERVYLGNRVRVRVDRKTLQYQVSE